MRLRDSGWIIGKHHRVRTEPGIRRRDREGLRRENVVRRLRVRLVSPSLRHAGNDPRTGSPTVMRRPADSSDAPANLSLSDLDLPREPPSSVVSFMYLHYVSSYRK